MAGSGRLLTAASEGFGVSVSSAGEVIAGATFNSAFLIVC